MKNLNPDTGITQVANGYIFLLRRVALDLIKNKGCSPTELGYFIIFLISADWDEGKYRNGFIRHGIPKLEEIWGISPSSLYRNIRKLKERGLINEEKDTLKIKDFQKFTSAGAQEIAKDKLTVDKIRKRFSISRKKLSKSEKLEAKNPDSFKSSSKGSSSVYPKIVLVKQERRSEKEYQRMYEEGNYQKLFPKDMEWLDKNIWARVKIYSRKEEREIIKSEFNGDRSAYKKALIENESK